MDYRYEIIKREKDIPINIYIHKTKSVNVMKHWHNDVELTYVLNGEISNISIDGKIYSANKDDIFIINSNSIHSMNVEWNKNNEAVTFLIPYEFLKEIYCQIDNKIFECMSFKASNIQEESKYESIKLIIKKLLILYKEKEVLWEIKFRSLLYELIYILLKEFSVDKNNQILDNKLKKVSDICNYITENYSNGISVMEIANKYRYSQEYLCRYFKKYTGITIYQYINNIRLQNAYKDLVTTKESILSIALKNGFPNQKSFANYFKSIYGVNPSVYRKKVYNYCL